MPRPLPLPRQWLLDQAFVLYLTSQALDPTTVCLQGATAHDPTTVCLQGATAHDPTTVCLQERLHMLHVEMEPGTCVHSLAWKG